MYPRGRSPSREASAMRGVEPVCAGDWVGLRVGVPMVGCRRKWQNMRYQMTARTDRSDPSRYSPAYAIGIHRGGSRVAEGDALAGVREAFFQNVR